MNSSSLIRQAILHINYGDIYLALVKLNNALKIDVFGTVFKKKVFLWNTIRNAVDLDNSSNEICDEQTESEVKKLFKSIEFEERNMSALKMAIVETLEHRPNNSCKRDDITAEVLRTVGMDLRGKERQIFKKRVTTALARLRKSKVVKQYQTSKNVRIRLSNNYAIRLKRLKSNWKRQLEKAMAESANQDGIDQQDNFHKSPLPEDEIDQQDNFYKSPLPESVLDKPNQKKTLISDSNSSMNLPDLPDIIDPDLHMSQNSQDAYEEEIEHDEDSMHLLGILTNDNSQFDASPKNQGKEFQDQSEPGDLLEYLKSLFENNRHFEISRFFLNTLQIKVKYSSKPFEIKIEHHPEFTRIIVKSYFEIIKKSVSALFSLAGKDDFTSTLGTTIIDNKRLFVVHKTISTLHTNPDLISKIIIQSLSEIIKINEIIERHKHHNSL